MFGGDELAAEGFGEDRLGESVEVPTSLFVAGFAHKWWPPFGGFFIAYL